MLRTLVLLSASAIAALGLQTTGASGPASLVTLANVDPLAFIQLLAEADVPAGLELREVDYERFVDMRPRWKRDEWNRERFDRDETVPIAQIADAFNHAHADYTMEVEGGVLVVRPVTQRAHYLDSEALTGRLTATGLMVAGEKLFTPIDSRFATPGGRVGSALAPLGVDVDDGRNIAVDIDADALTVVQILNRIATQARGHSWIVTTTSGNTPTVASFGFAHRYGVVSRQPIRADR